MLKVRFRSDPHGSHLRTQAEGAAITRVYEGYLEDIQLHNMNNRGTYGWIFLGSPCILRHNVRPRQTTEAHLASAYIISTHIPLAKGSHMAKYKLVGWEVYFSHRGVWGKDDLLNSNTLYHSLFSSSQIFTVSLKQNALPLSPRQSKSFIQS